VSAVRFRISQTSTVSTVGALEVVGRPEAVVQERQCWRTGRWIHDLHEREVARRYPGGRQGCDRRAAVGRRVERPGGVRGHRAHPQLEDVPEVARRRAHRRAGQAGVLQVQRPRPGPRQVDHELDPFPGCEDDGADRHRRRQVARVGGDLPHRHRGVGQPQGVEARGRSVGQAEPVDAEADVEVRQDRAVDHRGVAEELRHPLLRVVELPGGAIERLVLQDQRQVVDPVGARHPTGDRPVLVLVVEVVQPRQPRVDVEPRDPERVVVVPDRPGLLVVVVVVGVALTRDEGVLRVPVRGLLGVAAVQVDRRAGMLGVVVVVGTVQAAVDRQRVRTQVVVRGEGQRLTASGADHRSEVGRAAVAERGRRRLRQVGVEHVARRRHRERPAVQLRGRELGRDRQRVPPHRQGLRVEQLLRWQARRTVQRRDAPGRPCERDRGCRGAGRQPLEQRATRQAFGVHGPILPVGCNRSCHPVGCTRWLHRRCHRPGTCAGLSPDVPTFGVSAADGWSPRRPVPPPCVIRRGAWWRCPASPRADPVGPPRVPRSGGARRGRAP
jgi:hypothetical protein